MAQQADNSDVFKTSEQDKHTGRDIPGGDGSVSDEDVNDVTGGKDGGQKKTGQDHSLENYGESMPDSGVGAVQDYSDTTSDVARIKE